MLRSSVAAWVDKKFTSRAKIATRERAWPGLSWQYIFVSFKPKAAGIWIFGGGVQRQQASRVAIDGTVTDGPVPESKAVIGGFSVIEVPTHEEAIAWAARIARIQLHF